MGKFLLVKCVMKTTRNKTAAIQYEVFFSFKPFLQTQPKWFQIVLQNSSNNQSLIL